METFTYNEIPQNQTFTTANTMMIFYEDTEEGGKRSFHSYLNGELYKSNATNMVRKSDIFYACDINGNYIPVSLVLANRKLMQENKRLKKILNTNTALPTMVSLK